jgi:nitrogenase molybdenum-iron protein NifN
MLAELSANEVPTKYKRQRSQLMDAMLDGHFYFGGKRVAMAAEPDLLFALSTWFAEMGAEIQCVVTTTPSPLLHRVPCAEVVIGDLEDLEQAAVGADLLVTHSHGRQAAERLGIPLFRAGIPTFDRIGAAHQVSVGYRGTRELIFAVGNLLLGAQRDAVPEYCNQPETDRNHATPTIRRH